MIMQQILIQENWIKYTRQFDTKRISTKKHSIQKKIGTIKLETKSSNTKFLLETKKNGMKKNQFKSNIKLNPGSRTHARYLRSVYAGRIPHPQVPAVAERSGEVRGNL
jgi:hypothetical protein